MTRYEVAGWAKYAEEDSFEYGCLDNGTWFQGHEQFSSDTVSGLVEKLRQFVPFDSSGDAVSLDACGNIGRIDISGMETDDGFEPTKAERERWKRGKLRLWYVTYAFQVEQVSRETVALIGAQ